MTGKRYKYVGANLECSNGKEYMLVKRSDGFNVCQVCSKYTAKEIVDELNSLADENEELRKQNTKQIVEYNGLNCEYGWLKEENEQLLKKKIDVETKLYKANEQLLMQMDYDAVIKQNEEDEIKIINVKKENEQLKKELNAFKPVCFQDMRKGTVILYQKGDVE